MILFNHFDDMAAHLKSAHAIDGLLEGMVQQVGKEICPLCLASELEQFVRWLRTGDFDAPTELREALKGDVMKMLRGKNEPK